jgi:hypothetical protein
MTTTPKVLLKRSSVVGKVPLPGDLEFGEIAINFADGKIYYKDASNAIRAFVDSARVEGIAAAVQVIAEAQLDSGEVTNLIDSAYVQARQDFAYASLTGVPTNLSQFANDTNYLDSATVLDVIDQAYIRANQDYAYASLTGAPNVLDSADVAFIHESLTTIDSAGIQSAIDSAYVQARVDKQFIDTLNVDADTLDSLDGSYYLDYNNFTNTPNVLDSANINSIIDSQVDKTFVDALNIDADTLDGLNSTQFVRSDQSDSIRGSLIIDSNLTVGGYLAGPASFYIDPAGIGDNTGTVIIRGSLQVDGTTTTINSTTVSIDDKTFVIAADAVDDNAADGAGIIINGASLSMLYDAASDDLIFNKGIQVPELLVNGNITGNYVGFDSDFAAKSTTDLSEGSNLYYTTTRADSDFDVRLATKTTTNVAEGSNLYYTTARHDSDTLAQVDSAYVQSRQDYAYASLTGAPTNVSQFANDAGYLTSAQTTDSAEVQSIIDSNFQNLSQSIIPAANATYDLGTPSNRFRDLYLSGSSLYIGNVKITDSNGDISFKDLSGNRVDIANIDSAYVQLRQDFAYASLTGAPTNVSQFANDAGYLTDANTLDSAEAIALIDSAYVQQRQDYAYASLTGAPTNVSQFANDANYLDSNTSQAVINTNFAAKTTDDLTEGSTNQYYLKARVDSDIAASLSDSVNTVTVTINNTIEEKVDSAYVLARIIEAPFLDSADAINLIDSAYVQQRQDYAYASLTGVPTLVSQFTNDAEYISTGDSAILGFLDVTGNVVIGGNLQVQGTTFTANTASFSVDDNLFYLNDAESAGSPTQYVDIGFSGNVNDQGSFTHAGFFRDATDATWKVFETYYPLPDTAEINTSDSSFSLGAFEASTLTGQYLGFDSDFGTKTTSNLTEGSNQYYTNARVTAHVDAAYVQARQDYAYASLTGAPTNVSAFTNDAGYITNVDAALDSAEAINLIDSAYVRQRVTNSDLDMKGNKVLFGNVYATTGDLPSASSYHGMFAHVHDQGAGYFAHAGSWIRLANQSEISTYGNSDVIALIDSAYINARVSATDSAAVISIINSTVDSAYVQLRQSIVGAGGTDSATVSAIILTDVDSAYVQARQSNEAAAPLTQVSYDFVATLGQTSFTGLDIDSGKFQVYLNGMLLPSVDYSQNNTQVDLLIAADSGDQVSIIKFSGNDTGATAIQQRHYVYTATSSQTIFTGADDNAATLSYTQGRVNVYLNGLLLLDTVDYTQNAAGDTITFTSGVTAGHIVNIQTLSGNTGTFAPLSQTLYEFTADSGQTVFTGIDDNAATLDFSDDKVVVYLNGILLTSTDYTLSGGNTVTLDTATDSGNHLTVAKLSGNNIGLDSAQVNALIALSPGTDSAAIINLIDSAYVQARTTAGTDSATVVSIVNEYIDQTATSLTTTSTDQVVDTFAAATYRTAKYLVQFSHPSNSKYHSTEVLLMHDGTTVYMTEYAEVKTDSSLGTIDADINAGNVRLLVTPSYTNTGVNVTRTNVTV